MIAKVFMWHWNGSHVTDMWYSCESCDRQHFLYCGHHSFTYQLYTHTSVFSLPMGRTCTDASCGFVVIVWVILSDSRQSRTVFLSLLTHTLLPSASAIAGVSGRHVVTEEESSNSWRVLYLYVECAYNDQWIESHSLVLCRAKTREWGNPQTQRMGKHL